MAVPLPPGQFGSIQMLASGVMNLGYGEAEIDRQAVPGQLLRRNVREIHAERERMEHPQDYTGETTALSMPYSDQIPA